MSNLKRTGILIQARMSSSRLPGKSLMVIGGLPLIHRAYLRAASIGLPVVICTSTDASDDLLADYLSSHKIPIFRGSLHNVLQRFIGAAQQYQFERIIRLTGDNPFVNVEFLHSNLEEYAQYSYVDGIHKQGFIYGTGFEIIDRVLLETIPSNEPYYTEHVTSYYREHMPEDGLSLVPPAPYHFDSKTFLTVDYPEDLILARAITQELGNNPLLSLDDILNLLSAKPDLKEINASMHQV